ncbi:hypothetical protein EHS86_17520 [Erwinia amylovora]|nr:hypothetical protein EHS86_17520 [Erwinia amylovora]
MIAVLKSVEAGRTVEDVCREAGISATTLAITKECTGYTAC